MKLVWRRQMGRFLRAMGVLILLAASHPAWASEYRGLVTFGGLPVPGATVTVTQGGKKFVTVTDSQGFYSFSTLADGAATVDVEMTGFTALKQEVTVAADAALGKLELTLLSLEQMRSTLKPVLSAPFTEVQARSEVVKTGDAPKKPADQAAAAAAPPEEVSQRATDGLLVNGSVNNAATSQFSLAQRFGNTASGRSLYNFSLNVRVENSALDANSYSLSGVDTAKPQTTRLTGGFALQGPLKIPHLLRNGPNIFIGYQRTENSTAVSTPGLVPSLAVRNGDFSNEVNSAGQPVVVYDPSTGKPYAGDKITNISPQAQALLALYPLPMPNVVGNPSYNYQIPLVTDTHQDALNSNANKTIGRKNQLSGNFAVSSTRTSFFNLLGFVDKTHTLGLSTSINWSHTYSARIRTSASYQFSRQSNRLTPYWQDRTFAGQDGITGNDKDPTYAGPPTLNFSGGLTSLSDGQSSFTRNETNGVSYTLRWTRSQHNITVGGDLRRQQFNYLSQANPRGTFTFTNLNPVTSGGVAGAGSDVADFLIGIPHTSAISFGNADKYLRETVYDAYLTDDWRVSPQLTINAGMRYEYSAPVTEIKNRLVNIEVAPGFTGVTYARADAPLPGQSYPNSLTRPDRSGIEPRIGASWRPFPGSSMVLSAGYGITYDTSVYPGIGLNLAQQFPFSSSLIVQNSATCPLTLAMGFRNCATATPDTFGVDPNFRLGNLQTWNLKVQRDLPGALQMTAIYLGNKGTHGAQLFLPNTLAPGLPACTANCPPAGFEYLASGGTSTRESGQLQLRRRLKSGFTASMLYTFSKSIDDDASLGGQGAATLGSARIAQDWQNLRGERGLSNFDQRHLLNVQIQYTTGMGKGGGTLLTGWRGRVYKEWTFQTEMDAGTGLPETPLAAAISTAGYSSFVRPNVTGAPLYAAPAGRYLNPAAFTTPLGMFGNARRNSITGPSQFTLNSAMVRTFRLPHKMNLDAQMAASNTLNHVTYSSYIANINSTQFGLPAAANAMRILQLSLRLRF